MKNFVQSAFLFFLRTCTKLQLQKYSPTIIGITGSAGKSSAVRAAAIVLQTKHNTQFTKKGNSETGIGFEVLGIPVDNYSGAQWLWICFLSLWKLLTYWPKYDLLVAEMGIDSDQEPKNMTYHLRVIQPQVGAFLNVTSVHGQNFRGPDILQSIANEKGKLLHSLPKKGLGIYSLDYPEIIQSTQKLKVPTKTFSVSSKKADMLLQEYEVNLLGTRFSFTYKGETYALSFPHQCHTQASFGSFATALLIGEYFDVSIIQGIRALENNYVLPPGRMSVFAGMNKTVLLDSSYNSSPTATFNALEMLNQLPTKGRKVAVLGDMRELGERTEEDHGDLARTAIDNADIIVFVGSLTNQYSYPIAQQKKSSKQKVLSFITAWEAIEPLQELLKPSDVLLIKGSQNTIFLEIIVEALLANPADKKLLCRQGEYWDVQRDKLKKT